jgi:hypothetical protein
MKVSVRKNQPANKKNAGVEFSRKVQFKTLCHAWGQTFFDAGKKLLSQVQTTTQSMIIYNVTVKIDTAYHEEWLKWMKETHIPDVMRTGCFTENRMLKVLTGDEPDGSTYSIQYTCKQHE